MQKKTPKRRRAEPVKAKTRAALGVQKRLDAALAENVHLFQELRAWDGKAAVALIEVMIR
jgi:hypothetical protein